jgi:hypothetical protein
MGIVGQLFFLKAPQQCFKVSLADRILLENRLSKASQIKL